MDNANLTGWEAIRTATLRTGCRPRDPRNLEIPMKLFSALTVIAIAAAGPVLAEGKCATGPKSKWQPKSVLETQLQADGYKVPGQGQGRVLRGLRHRQGRQARQYGLQRRDIREA